MDRLQHYLFGTDLRRLARLLGLLDDVLEGADVLVDAAQLLHVRHLLGLQLLELGAVLGQALLLLLHRVHVDQQRDPRLLQVYRFMTDVLQSFQLGESLPFINTGHGGAAGVSAGWSVYGRRVAADCFFIPVHSLPPSWALSLVVLISLVVRITVHSAAAAPLSLPRSLLSPLWPESNCPALRSGRAVAGPRSHWRRCRHSPH